MLKAWGRIGLLSVLLAASVVVLLLDVVFRFHIPAGDGKNRRIVVIQPATSFQRIVRILEKNDIIRDAMAFRIAALYLGVANKLKAGEYALNDGMSALEVLDRLSRGGVVQHRFAVPEGATLQWIAVQLEQQGLAGLHQFLEKAADSHFLRELKIDAPSAEGYLFPDTYLLTRTMKEEAIIRMMVRRFWQILTPQMALLAQEKKLSIHQLVTLSSMVEKETGKPEERPLIAAVFLNRLARNIRLQSDPTVIYGMEHFDGNLRREDLIFPTHYNTYHIQGLPPGPIANPGRDSILAVLQPAQVDYLYFVSRNDGTHQFSSNLMEHNQAVWRYQKGGQVQE